MKIGCQRDNCTPTFTEALFTVAKTWKQPKCPSEGEWIKKIKRCDIQMYIIKYYHSAMRKKDNVSLLMTWMDLKSIM